jgi:hypothetical protein
LRKQLRSSHHDSGFKGLLAMMIFRSRTAAVLAAAAALSLTATPAMARGWHRHGDGIDGGDVVAGLLIFGGIAAIAAAASKSSKDRQARTDDRYRDSRDYREDDSRYVPPADERSDSYRDRPDNNGPSSNWRSGLSVDGAVDACVGEVEQGSRSIDSVEAVNRDGDGWRVSGRVRGGSDFACSVDGQGRVRSVSGL